MPPVGGRRERATLKWDPDDYRPDYLKKMDEKELRAEYTRLRDISQKRLAALGRSEFKEFKVYTENVNKFKKLADIKSKTELAFALSDIANFVNRQTSSVRGLQHERAAFITGMHQRGYTFVTKDNYFAVRDFFESWREQKLSKIFGSERVEKAFQIAETKGIAPEDVADNFYMWLTEQYKIEQWQPPKNSNKHTSAQIKKDLGIKTPRKKTSKRKAANKKKSSK